MKGYYMSFPLITLGPELITWPRTTTRWARGAHLQERILEKFLKGH